MPEFNLRPFQSVSDKSQRDEDKGKENLLSRFAEVQKDGRTGAQVARDNALIRAADTGPLPMTQTSLASPPSGSVTNGPRLDDLSSSVTRARPPNIAVYDAPLRTANERSTTLPRTSRS